MKDKPMFYMPGGYAGRGKFVKGFWYTPLTDDETRQAMVRDNAAVIDQPARANAKFFAAVRSMSALDWTNAVVVVAGLSVLGFKVAAWLLGVR